MKVKLEMDDILEAWKLEFHERRVEPGNSTIEPVVNAICDVCHNHYQAASYLIDGAFQKLPPNIVAAVLLEHGYTKTEGGTE